MSQKDNNPYFGLDSLGSFQPRYTTLASVFGRPEVRGLYYNGTKVALDGYHFIGCRFDNCTLEISSTNFNLTGCVIDAATTITYSQEVLKVIKLFNSRYPWAYTGLPGFVPTLNPDGTITI